MNAPKIIFQDADLLVLFKPAQMYVHPPERKHIALRVGRHTCIHWLEDHHGLRAFPIHRLDYATEGLVIFGLHKEAASLLNQQMRGGEIKKFYDVIVRGWLTEPQGQIDLPLELDSTGDLVEALTLYSTFAKIELPFSVNSKFQTTRYSWLDIELITGRWHQIRRHMNRIAHPAIGDREHGDSHHNRFFRDQLKIDGLCLRAKQIRFLHPRTEQELEFQSPLTEKWQSLQKIFSAVQS